MKNLITSFFLLFSLTMFGQDWQLDGTKYPNATNEGDTVSLATKIPLWDADNLQNYFAELGDILALNPAPPTPTLQSVTEAGATTDQGIQITGQAGVSVIDGLKLYTAGSSSIIQNYISGAPRSTINFLPNTTQIAFHPSGGGTQTIFNIQEESISNPGVQLDSRLGIEYAINNNEAVTLGQVIDSIQANSATNLQEVLDNGGSATGNNITLTSTITEFPNSVQLRSQGVSALDFDNSFGRYTITPSGAPSYTNGNLNFYTPKTNGGISSSTKFSLHVADNITDPDAHVASFHGRVKGRPAQDDDEIPSLGQVIDSIQANSIAQESGTFTPTLIDGNGGATYTPSIVRGSYIKTGKVVMCSINFDGISTSGTPNGALRITGLPYLEASGFVTGDIYRFINSGLTTLPTSVSVSGNSLYFTEPTSVEVIEAPTFNSGTVTIRITYTTDE